MFHVDPSPGPISEKHSVLRVPKGDEQSGSYLKSQQENKSAEDGYGSNGLSLSRGEGVVTSHFSPHGAAVHFLSPQVNGIDGG